jgi:hypothetical protein
MSSPSAGIPTSTWIHAGVEIVVASAIVFWVYTRNKDAQDQNRILSERIDKLEEIIKKQGEIIVHHENALRQFHTMLQGSANSSPPPKKTHIPQNKNPTTQNNRKNMEKTLDKSHLRELEEMGIPEENIDDLLADEIEDLDSDGLKCTDEECEVSPDNKKK